MTRPSALAMLVLGACSRQPREALSPAPSVEATRAPAVGDSDITITKSDPGDDLEWVGDPGPPLPASGVELIVIGKDDNVVFSPPNDSGHADVLRLRFHRQQIWSHPLVDGSRGAAEMLRDGDTIYVAHYSAIDSGGTIHALALATGAERWATPIQGLGPVQHSQYANRIVLRMIRGRLVAFGNESGGRYLEVFDPATGQRLSTRTLPGHR